MIAVLLPTRNKPEELQRILTQIQATSTEAQVFAYVADDDPQFAAYKEFYDSLDLNHSILHMFHGPQLGFSKGTNFLAGCSMLFKPDMIMRCEDDFHFVIPGWDLAYLAEMPKDGIGMVWCNYVLKGPEAEPHTAAVGRRWYETLGWFSFPKVHHWYCDNALRDMAESIGRSFYIPTPFIEHRWNPKDPRKTDGLTPNERLLQDTRFYQEWRFGRGFHEDCVKLEEARWKTVSQP